MKYAITSVPALLLSLVCACSSSGESDPPTARDASGNYATTSEYNATYRRDFVSSIHSGLDDVDRRTRDLETRANQLGQAAVNRLHEHLPVVTEKRTKVVNTLTRLEAALDSEWQVRRADVDAAYKDLRATLDTAYAKVLNE
jgi:hypothetical protein